MQPTLEKSPEVKRLIRALRKAAPHLLFSARDKRRFYERQYQKRPPIWETLRKRETGISDRPNHATPLQPICEKPDKSQYVADGKPIPKRVKRGISGGLIDKLK